MSLNARKPRVGFFKGRVEIAVEVARTQRKRFWRSRRRQVSRKLNARHRKRREVVVVVAVRSLCRHLWQTGFLQFFRQNVFAVHLPLPLF